MSDNNSANKWTAKRIAAIIGIVLLVGMYIALFILAFIFPANSFELFITAVGGTVGITILIWLMIWVIGLFTGRHTIASLDAMTSDQDHDKYGNAVPRKPSSYIDTIIFDIGNVLVDFSWRQMLADKGIPEDLIEKVGDATVRTDIWNEFDRGIMSHEEIIDKLCEQSPELSEYIHMGFDDFKGIVKLRSTSIPLIEGLKKAHYRVLVLSNFSKNAVDTNKVEMAFLDYVDGGILSYKNHVIKPDSDIYELIIKRYDLTPDKCVFIDDTEKNVIGAIRSGIKGIHFQSIEQMMDELKKLGIKRI
ncbi:HAD family hydrolase [Butyrivibrio fibrisolvens]|uniref:HAD family hydrolase n=1 Tax=Butyrivibrio fibrisolvens TaxID=831 RepID=UPI0003B76EE7|nr:HAD family phosphatase [Butyrivibrio fibrisolvens]